MSAACDHRLVPWNIGPGLVCLLCRERFAPFLLLNEAKQYVVSYIKQDENAGPFETGAKAARDLLKRIEDLT